MTRHDTLAAIAEAHSAAMSTANEPEANFWEYRADRLREDAAPISLQEDLTIVELLRINKFRLVIQSDS